MTLQTRISRRRRIQDRLLLIGILLLAGVVGFTGFLWLIQPTHRSEMSHQENKKPAPTTTGLASKSLFMGDVYWGRFMNGWSQASPLKTAYPFSRLNEFHRENYDAWIANLECPTVPGVTMSAAREDATLTFNCDPSYLPEAAKWFTVLTNANNHSGNQDGQTGLDTTRGELEKNGIQYAGNFDPEVLNDVCEVISLPIRVDMSDGTAAKKHLPVALCGYHGVLRIPSKQSLAVMQRYSKLMPVIALPHAGTEYVPAPDQLKTDLYRSMIDNGADVVLGNHPHWVQTSEAYKGHLIVYSMGNFIFDQQDTPEVTRSVAVGLDLALASGSDASQLDQWIRLAESCKTFHDTCLDRAEKQGLKKLNLAWKFSIVGSRDDGHLAHPATEAETVAILSRLKWQQTITGLQAPYSGS